MAGQPRTASCQQLSLDEFFGDLLEEKEFRALKEAIQTALSEVKVYRCGSIQVTYFVVGSARDGRLAGLKITAVET